MQQRNISKWTLATLVLGNVALLAGCGLSPATTTTIATPSQPTPTSNAGQTPSGSNTPPNTTPSTPDSGGAVQLVSAQFSGITVKVPSGWTKTSIGGSGDWGGFKWVNPSDAKASITVVFSSCVGCYMDQSGKPDPRLVIPVSAPAHVTLQHNGLSASYDVASADNVYPGSGMVTVSQNSTGYAYVEVHMPKEQSSLSEQILASFQLA